MFNYQQQMNQCKEQMARAGISGRALIDIQPAKGIIRIKIQATPEKLPGIIQNYAQVLTMSLGMLNIEAKVHVTQEDQ
jgi:hypothetical protein